jgi:hypothetical protein
MICDLFILLLNQDDFKNRRLPAVYFVFFAERLTLTMATHEKRRSVLFYRPTRFKSVVPILNITFPNLIQGFIINVCSQRAHENK